MKIKKGLTGILTVLLVVLFGTSINGFYKIREVQETKPIEVSTEDIKKEQDYYNSFIGREVKDIMIDLEKSGFEQVEKQVYENGYTFIKYNGESYQVKIIFNQDDRILEKVEYEEI